MKKIPTLFMRDEIDRGRVVGHINEECSWVLDGEGIATRKYDGTAVLMQDGRLFKRFTTQHPGFVDERGREKKPQCRLDFYPVTEIDPITGKQEGWVPVGEGPEDRNMRDAWMNTQMAHGDLVDGTYEFVGPKVNGNPEGLPGHEFIDHKMAEQLVSVPLDFLGIKEYLACNNIEGIVWHHPDGRMAKIKQRDFGFKRKNYVR